MSNSLLRCVCLTAIALSLPASGVLAGEIQASGVYTGIPDTNIVIEKADGTSAVHFSIKGILVVDDESNPWHNAQTDCFGSAAYDAEGGLIDQGGYCAMLDTDGDFQRFTWTGGAESGTWAAVGGSGKYANMTGDGTFKSAATLADGRFVNDWTFTQITP